MGVQARFESGRWLDAPSRVVAVSLFSYCRVVVLAQLVLAGVQADTGSLAVTIVVDAGGGPIPGAQVTVSGSTYHAGGFSNSAGVYALGRLAPGQYKVEVTLAGFESETRQTVEIRRGLTSAVTVSLRLRVRPDELSHLIGLISGSNPVDCGQLPAASTESAMRASVDCSVAAAAKKQASVTVRFETGVDSILASGLIVTPAGSVLLFHYDSAPCGGPDCSPRFTTEVCAAPALVGAGSGVRFACGSPLR